MTRYVVSLRPTGLGDRLICLVGAWIFARNTGRTLIVDWRGSLYSREQRENIFSLCFANTDDLAGVPLIVADDADAHSLPRPVFPDHWDRDDLPAEPWRGPKEDSFDLRDQQIAVIRSGADIAAPTVVLNTCINDGVSSFADAHRCLEALKPVPAIAAAVEDFYRDELAGRPVIGLHIRHGNGGNILAHGRYWRSFGQGIDRCRQAVMTARARIGAEAPVFLCTDSLKVEIAIRKVIPNVVTRAKAFRPPGRGELQYGPAAHAGLEDALAEMLLLARCNVLIRYPPASFFSFLAAVLKPSAMPDVEAVETLAQPFDPKDPLSCAVLF